jgi:hypothetical protein
VRASRDAMSRESESVLIASALILSICFFNTVSGAFASLSGHLSWAQLRGRSAHIAPTWRRRFLCNGP